MKNKGSIILTLTEEGNVITSFEIDLKKVME